MSKIITEEGLTRLFHNKANSAKQRLISWEFELEEFIALYKMRSVLTCFYTDRKFNLRDTCSKDFPTLERLDDNKPYSKDNTIFCTKHVNKLKANYIEAGKSMKGIGEDAHIVQRIRKVLDNPIMIEERKKPYYDIYDKVLQRKQEELDKIERRDQITKDREEAQRQQRIKDKAKNQRNLAKSYVEKYEEFEKLGVVFEVSIKEYRDMVRITKCKICKEEFKDIWDKHLYVIDKTKPITKSNLLVVKKNVQESLDHLSQGDMMVLKNSALNILKYT